GCHSSNPIPGYTEFCTPSFVDWYFGIAVGRFSPCFLPVEDLASRSEAKSLVGVVDPSFPSKRRK
ncbi:MAG: hypothetical protein VW877_12800, partial [Pseudomonadaceae bacterium]